MSDVMTTTMTVFLGPDKPARVAWGEPKRLKTFDHSWWTVLSVDTHPFGHIAITFHGTEAQIRAIVEARTI